MCVARIEKRTPELEKKNRSKRLLCCFYNIIFLNFPVYNIKIKIIDKNCHENIY